MRETRRVHWQRLWPNRFPTSTPTLRVKPQPTNFKPFFFPFFNAAVNVVAAKKKERKRNGKKICGENQIKNFLTMFP